MLLVGSKIKKLRELKGLKQEYMADKLKMSQPAYSRLEKDEVKIDIETLDKIAEVFEMRVEDLLRFDEKISYYVNNNDNSHAANVAMNYGTINDIENFNKLLIQINERIERIWKEIEILKNERKPKL
jgi:transcriptional regulator with XRE-family HTH domain